MQKYIQQQKKKNQLPQLLIKFNLIEINFQTVNITA